MLTDAKIQARKLGLSMLIGAFLVCLFTSSCSTVGELRSDGLESMPYRGTATNLKMIAMGEQQAVGYVLVVRGVLDFPFSLAADTLLLPANLFHWVVLEEGDEQATDEV